MMMAFSQNTELALTDAINAFSQGHVEKAKSILDAVVAEPGGGGGGGGGFGDGEMNDLLAIRCVRASIAAMGGERSIANLMTGTAQSPLHRPLVLYLEGLAMMADGTSLQTARMKFEEALRVDRHFILAKLGLATVSYHTQKYKECFTHYREVLETLGSASPLIVRVGMALCAYRLGHLEYAQKWLERALDVDPNDELALLALLVILLDRRQIPRVIEVVRQLRRALPNNAMVLLKVADLAYFKALSAPGRVPAAAPAILQLLREARAVASAGEAAVADFQEGRLCLALGDLAAARTLLEAAMQAAPALLAARVHHARLLVLSGREAEAEQLLLCINAEHPNQKEVLQLLAACAARRGMHERAFEYSRRLIQSVAPGDMRSWEIAAWCARLDRDDTRKLMAHVARIRKEVGDPVPTQLLANIAALSGDTDALQGILDRELGANFLSQPNLPVASVPLVFNLALLLEEQDRARARELYICLVKHHGYFQLPYIRLHVLAKADGLLRQAVAWLVLLQQVVPEEPTSLAAIGQTFFDQQRFMAAMTALRSARSRSIPVALALGATFLWCCQQHGKDNRRFLVSAKDRFAFVLRRDKGNILAAHGLACCVGLEADYDRSQTLLDRVGEVQPNCEYVRRHYEAHMANVKTLCDSFKQAIDYLERDPKRTPLQTSSLAFCLACENRYDDAIAALTQAVKENPDISLLQYNLALLYCASFVAAVSQRETLTPEKARELRHSLAAGLSVAFDFIRQEPRSQAMAVAKTFIKSVCAYCLDMNDRNLHRLIVAGQRDAGEYEQQAVLWRHVYNELQVEKRNAEEQRAAEERQRREQEAQVSRAILEDFRRSQLSQPAFLDSIDGETRARLEAYRAEFNLNGIEENDYAEESDDEEKEEEEEESEGDRTRAKAKHVLATRNDTVALPVSDISAEWQSAAIISGMNLEEDYFQEHEGRQQQQQQQQQQEQHQHQHTEMPDPTNQEKDT